MSFMGNCCDRGPLPERGACFPVKAQQSESPRHRDILNQGRFRFLTAFFPGPDCSLNQDLVAPDDGRTVAAVRHPDFPLHILGLTPGNRRVSIDSDTSCIRTPPSRPIIVPIICIYIGSQAQHDNDS